MTNDEVKRFEKIQGQFEGLYNEICLLAKKNPMMLSTNSNFHL